MKINDWTVMSDKNGYHHYFYGFLEEFEPEDYSELDQVPYGKWDAADFAEILGNVLEERNHHWMTDIPLMLLDILKDCNLPDDHKDFIMKNFAEKLEKEKFS